MGLSLIVTLRPKIINESQKCVNFLLFNFLFFHPDRVTLSKLIPEYQRNLFENDALVCWFTHESHSGYFNFRRCS